MARAVCATHSPILTSLRGAEILELSEEGISPRAWRELGLTRHWIQFLEDPDSCLKYLTGGSTESAEWRPSSAKGCDRLDPSQIAYEINLVRAFQSSCRLAHTRRVKTGGSDVSVSDIVLWGGRAHACGPRARVEAGRRCLEPSVGAQQRQAQDTDCRRDEATPARLRGPGWSRYRHARAAGMAATLRGVRLGDSYVPEVSLAGAKRFRHRRADRVRLATQAPRFVQFGEFGVQAAVANRRRRVRAVRGREEGSRSVTPVRGDRDWSPIQLLQMVGEHPD